MKIKGYVEIDCNPAVGRSKDKATGKSKIKALPGDPVTAIHDKIGGGKRRFLIVRKGSEWVVLLYWPELTLVTMPCADFDQVEKRDVKLTRRTYRLFRDKARLYRRLGLKYPRKTVDRAVKSVQAAVSA
jgi:hypothetical protein